MYLAWNVVHAPCEAPQHYIDRHAHIEDKGRRNFAAMLSSLDEALPQVIDALKAKNMWQNTVFIVTTDNGGNLGGSGNNWPLRGMKRSFFEGGVRTPAFVSGGALPLAARGRVLDGYIHLADWYATLKALAGSTEDAPEGSLSMASYIAGSVEQSPRQELVLAAGDTGTTVNGVEAVIRGEWKLINGSIPCGWATYQGAKFPNASSERTRGFMLPGCMHRTKTYLFNIQTDPHESHNLAESPAHQLKLAELFELLEFLQLL